MKPLSELKKICRPLTDEDRRDKDELYAPVQLLDQMRDCHNAFPELLLWAERARDLLACHLSTCDCDPFVGNGVCARCELLAELPEKEG